MTAPYMTVAEGFSATPAIHGEPTDSLGRHPTIQRHAYRPGGLNTLCGTRMAQMVYFVPGKDSWDRGGDEPPRCASCARLAAAE